MKVVHYFNENNRVAKVVDGEKSFLLTNKIGGYLWWNSQTTSRYQGWFFVPDDLVGQKIFRLVESIEIENAPAVEEIKNNFWECEQKRGVITEKFFLPPFLDVFSYQISEKANLTVVLDIKETYNNQSNNRFYEIFYENGLILIRYTQPDLTFPEIWLAIKSDSQETKLVKKWLLKHYAFDRKRNSPPFERYVFSAIKLVAAQRIIFAASKEKQKVIDCVTYAADNLNVLKKKAQKETKKLSSFFCDPVIKDPELKMAFLCAKNSLQGLLVFDQKKKAKMLYAGLPWFFQPWQRDTALSLKALSFVNRSAGQTIFEKMLVAVIKGEKNDSAVDGWGWLFKRSEIFSFKRKFLLLAIEEFIKNGQINFSKACFLYHSRTSWMDTVARAPYGLETQTLLLNAYQLAQDNYEFWRKKFFYRKQKNKSHKYLREKFWNNEVLADGLFENQIADRTVRPNVFLAALAYNKLLSKDEWQRCFENILPHLWLDWGGLATLDKKNSAFQGKHTGEIPLSYHQGVSWFFINNLAALILAQNNKKKFNAYIEKILKASAYDILWQGIIGHHSELSSANNLLPEGCLCQAWSSAFFLELLKKLY